MDAPAVVMPAATTLGGLATYRDQLREEKRDLEARVKELDEALRGNETDIIAILDEQGVTKSGVGPFSMSISEQTVGNVTDWDGVYKYVRENDAFHLIQRRLANAAYKEMLDLGETLTGVEPFIKRSLNFRKSSKSA